MYAIAPLSEPSNKLSSALDKTCRSAYFRLIRWLALLSILTAATLHSQSLFPATAVGTSATPQPVIVTAQAAGKVDSVQVLTAGAQHLDFSEVSRSCVGQTLSVTSECRRFSSPSTPATY